MYFICYVTPQDLSIEVSYIFMDESYSQHVITRKSFVAIGILIVDWIATRQEKNIVTWKIYILIKNTQKLKNMIFFPYDYLQYIYY